MKKILALMLVLASLFALCACGEIPSADMPVPSGLPEGMPADPSELPEEFAQFRDLADALAEGDYGTALAELEKWIPEMPPAFEEVEITGENFLDYFEFAEFPERPHRSDFDVSGSLVGVYGFSGFYLKPEYELAEEKKAGCSVEASVRYGVRFYPASGGSVRVDLDNCSYEILGAESWTDEHEEDCVSALTHDSCYLSFEIGDYLTVKKNYYVQIVDSASVELLSASGRLFLRTEAAPEAPLPEELPELPEEFAPFEDIILAFASGRYDTARALIEEMLPPAESAAYMEVKITADNFFDYFEFIAFPEEGTFVRKDDAGRTLDVFGSSGFCLKPGFSLAEDRKDDCGVTVGLCYEMVLYFVGSNAITVDLEGAGYTLNGPEEIRDRLDETCFGSLDEDGFFSVPFGTGSRLSAVKSAYHQIILEDSIELLSASGTLYLAG